jgi:hypothetical protein
MSFSSFECSSYHSSSSTKNTTAKIDTFKNSVSEQNICKRHRGVKKSMAFPVPIFMKLTHIQQNSSISLIPIFTQIKKQMWNVWAEINLCPFVKYEFQWQTFHETVIKPILVITSCMDFFPNWTKNAENGQILFTP